MKFSSDMMDDLLSEPEGSYSSRMSTKSEKNLADFEGEESNCDEELAQLAARAHQVCTLCFLEQNSFCSELHFKSRCNSDLHSFHRWACSASINIPQSYATV